MRRNAVDRSIEAIAAAQHGVFTRTQALAAGFTLRRIQMRIESKRWIVVERAVYAIGGSPPTWQREVMAHVLHAGPGAAVSGMTAARLWSMTDRRASAIEIVAPHHRRARKPIRRTRFLEPRDIKSIDGIPVTSPARTLAALAGTLDKKHFESVLDAALTQGLVSTESLDRFLVERSMLSCPGVTMFRALLRDRRSGVPGGELERRFNALVRRYRLPRPERQHPFRGFRIDFAYPDARLAIELDGRAHHSAKTDFQNDRRRQNVLVLGGWTVLRFTWDDVTSRGKDVAAQVREALRAGGGS